MSRACCPLPSSWRQNCGRMHPEKPFYPWPGSRRTGGRRPRGNPGKEGRNEVEKWRQFRPPCRKIPSYYDPGPSQSRYFRKSKRKPIFRGGETVNVRRVSKSLSCVLLCRAGRPGRGWIRASDLIGTAFAFMKNERFCPSEAALNRRAFSGSRRRFPSGQKREW